MSQRSWLWIAAAVVVVILIYFFMGSRTETPPPSMPTRLYCPKTIMTFISGSQSE